ncbi:hypothetical protein [Butyricimonas virosa]|uniref:hypothetical protein n=1 Tax=Butyricimonas virosa TaxID=544645 RepID=UPI00307BAE57
MKISKDSKFIFIATSKDYIEDRFLYDVNYGIGILKSRGVADEDIIVITDVTTGTWVEKYGNMINISFHASSTLDSVIENAECDNLFVVSCCHGSMDGIDSVTPIKPFALNQALKNNKYAKNILVFLGQCYAGIFNFMDVRDKEKNIVYIGATDINTSLSCKLNGYEWVVNISVVALFKWLESPRDVDGDGVYSVTDLYKFISCFTNNVTNEIEKRQTTHLIDASVRLKLEEARISSSQNPFMSQIAKDAVEAIKNYIVPHQNTWMLNAIAAGNMNLE